MWGSSGSTAFGEIIRAFPDRGHIGYTDEAGATLTNEQEVSIMKQSRLGAVIYAITQSRKADDAHHKEIVYPINTARS